MMGTKIAPLSAQWSSSSICLSCLLRNGQDEGGTEPEGGDEEHSGVPLHPPVLDDAEEAAALLGGEAGAVDDAVDALLVDGVVDEATDGPGDGGDAVDHGVDHVLVGPVGSASDRILDRANHTVDVDLVEEVLLLEDVVTGAGQAAAAGQTVRPEVAGVVPERHAEAQDGDGRSCEGEGGREGMLGHDLAGTTGLEGDPTGAGGHEGNPA